MSIPSHLRPFWVLLLLLVFTGTGFGTDISGPLSGIYGPGIYHVVGNISVQSGNSVQLMPGTTFIFDGPYSFEIYGTLLSEGTEEDSIIFTTDTLTNPDRWRGLRFYNSSSSGSQLAYTLIEHARATGNYPDNCGGGLRCDNGCSPSFTNCTIRGNHAGNGGGIWCMDSSPTLINCFIADNTAMDCGGGVYCYGSSPSITYCTICNNSAARGAGVACARTSTPVFTNCSISGNSGRGVSCYENSLPVFNSTIITFSTEEGICFDGGSSQVEYCDIFGNSGGSFVGTVPAGLGQISGTNANSDPCDQFFNIFLDPMFVDTATGDLRLTFGSPCIDAGDTLLPLDPDSTIADIGAFYSEHSPYLRVIPERIDFELLDLGTDSTSEVRLRNSSDTLIIIDTIFHSIPDYIIDTTGLNGQVEPQSTYYMNITFFPSAVGTYIDTLIIVAQQAGDDTIRIPLYGEADVIPMPVDSLVIQRGPLNGIELRWPPVTQSISGQPINADYIIYGAVSFEGEFVPFGYATDTSYVHPYILNSQSIYFYYVTAIPEGALTSDQIGKLIHGYE